MKKGKKTFTALYASLLFSILIFSLSLPQGYVHQNPNPRVNVYVIRETPEGRETLVSGNVITDIGEEYVMNIIGYNNVTAHNATQWIALGNSTVLQTETMLDAEATTTGFIRSANDTCIAWINNGDFAYNVTNQFTATGDIAVNATGLHWDGTSNTDNNMFAVASLGGMQAFQNNWNCTITWVITWNAN